MAFNRNLTNDPNRMKRVVLFLMAIKILTISAGLCNLSACKIGTKERTDTQRFCFKQKNPPDTNTVGEVVYTECNDYNDVPIIITSEKRDEYLKEKVECQIAAGYVFDCVDEMPSFPGGRQSLLEFIEKNFCYPEDLAETCFHGRVIITFIVEESGELTDIRVVKGLHPSLDKEAIRIVKKMPRWIPGKQYGKNVRVKYTIPVKIFD